MANLISIVDKKIGGNQHAIEAEGILDNSGNLINPATEETLKGLGGLVAVAYDYISLGYTGANLTSVVYKTGGSGGVTVATLTLGYSGSNLVSVTKT